MMWCGQEDALKSVHLRHAEKCELHAVADEELFILGVVCRGSTGWQRPEGAKPSCSILRFKHWLRHHVCAVSEDLREPLFWPGARTFQDLCGEWTRGRRRRRSCG